MKNLLKLSLQAKILIMVTSLSLIVIFLLSVSFFLIKMEDEIKNAESLALQAAKTLSYMPAIKDLNAIEESEFTEDSLIENLMYQVDGIVIANREGTNMNTVGDTEMIHLLEKSDQYKTLLFGSNQVIRSGSDEKEVLVGIAPIIIKNHEHSQIVGTVKVGFYMKTIRKRIYESLQKILLFPFVIFLLSGFGSYLLSKSIRKDTLGLEPIEISALYRERNAVIQSVKEGIIATDKEGKITMMNVSAKEILGIDEMITNINDFSNKEFCQFRKKIHSTTKIINWEVVLNERILIVNSRPIFEGGKRMGNVIILRDKTELKQMVDALSEVKKYSEDLRSQNHEYTNKLYAISGLLQLEKTENAVNLLQEELSIQENYNGTMFQQVRDERVQAILIGKLAKASEKKVTLTLDEGSTLSPLSELIKTSSLITILGNLIDNAFDAVANKVRKEVSFFTTDIGNDIIFEVSDNGCGIDETLEENIFKKGISTKGENRGYGLANVKVEVKMLGGLLEWTSSLKGGTTFTVVLPKIPYALRKDDMNG